MVNERSARGVQKTPSIGPNRMIPGGVVRPGSKGRFSGLARKQVDRSDWIFSWGHVSKCSSISRKGCCGNFPRGWDPGAYRVRRICHRHFRVDGLCLEGWNHLDIKEEVSTMKMSPCTSSASPSVSQFMLLKKMCEIALTASSRRAIVIWPITEEPNRITTVERVKPV